MADFRLAGPPDDRELRDLTSLPMKGDWVDLRYCREPSYFAGLSQPDDEVMMASLEGRLAGMTVRSRRPLYVNGRVQKMGYLSGLRVDPKHQGGFLLWKAFRWLHGREENRDLPYLCTIVEGNREAEALLVEKRRPSWLAFERYGQLNTLALAVGKRYPLDGLLVDPPLPQIATFLAEYGSQRQFFPAVQEMAGGEQRRWLAHDGGVAALRDLSCFHQVVVDRYAPTLGRIRWLYNLWAMLRKLPTLPRPGQSLPGVYSGFFSARWPLAFTRLLEGQLELARRAGKSWLYLGLMDNDPHLALARAYRHNLYRSTVYRLAWNSENVDVLDERPGYLELASL